MNEFGAWINELGIAQGGRRAYASCMAALHVRVECAQCGRDAPTDPRELSTWRHADLVSEDELDDVTAALVLCPDCDDDDRHGKFEPGEAG